MKYLFIFLLLLSCHFKDRKETVLDNRTELKTDTSYCEHPDDETYGSIHRWRLVNGSWKDITKFYYDSMAHKPVDTAALLEPYSKVGAVQDTTWDSVSFYGGLMAVPPLNIQETQNLTVDSKGVIMGTSEGYTVLKDTSKTKKEKGILAYNKGVYYYTGKFWIILFDN